MHTSCVLGWVKSLSSSLLLTTFFPAVLPLTSISLLAAPFSPEAPWEDVEDSSTVLCPASGVAWTVLHIINLENTGTHTQETLVRYIHDQPTTIPGKFWSQLNTPAPVAEDKEEHTEDDAGDSDVNADNDACGGCFALFVFQAVTWDVQHYRDTVHITVKQICRGTHKQETKFVCMCLWERVWVTAMLSLTLTTDDTSESVRNVNLWCAGAMCSSVWLCQVITRFLHSLSKWNKSHGGVTISVLVECK